MVHARTVSFDTIRTCNTLLLQGVVKIFTRVPETQEYLRVINFSLSPKTGEESMIQCCVTGYKLEQIQIIVDHRHKFDFFFV